MSDESYDTDYVINDYLKVSSQAFYLLFTIFITIAVIYIFYRIIFSCRCTKIDEDVIDKLIEKRLKEKKIIESYYDY